MKSVSAGAARAEEIPSTAIGGSGVVLHVGSHRGNGLEGALDQRVAAPLERERHRPVERYLRDAFHIFAPAGTSDIQLLRLGEAALGTSKGSWSQRFAEISAASAAEIRAELSGLV